VSGTSAERLPGNLVRGGESVVLAAKDESDADALAAELGANAKATSVEDAIARAVVVLLAYLARPDQGLVPARAHLTTEPDVSVLAEVSGSSARSRRSRSDSRDR
jgi:predicted dinucleotide-binding enzyme